MTAPTPTAGDNAHISAARTALVLVNLGTPEAPTAGAIRRYLREFLSDRRVVDLPRWLWWPLLNLVILPLRSNGLPMSQATRQAGRLPGTALSACASRSNLAFRTKRSARQDPTPPAKQ